MNSDISGEKADSALALGNGNNKRYPWAFVCMNIVTRALVQNINNAGKGGGGETNIWRTMAHSKGRGINYVCRRNSAGLCLWRLSLWKISQNFFKVSLLRLGSLFHFKWAKWSRYVTSRQLLGGPWLIMNGLIEEPNRRCHCPAAVTQKHLTHLYPELNFLGMCARVL